MQLEQAIRHRRAIRQFSDQPVTRAIIERLIDAAVHAPSAVNKQPWHFTVIKDAQLLDQVSSRAKQHMIALIGAGEAPQEFRDILGDPQFHLLYHAPLLIVISALKDDVWAREDAALAAQNLMLSAYAEGLGTCWIGFAQRWLGTKHGRQAIDVPEYYQPVAPIIVGHPKGTVSEVPRNLPIIHWIG